MNTAQYRFIGRGLYSLAEAQSLTGVPKRSIRRWVLGYRFAYIGSVCQPTPRNGGIPCLEAGALSSTRNEPLAHRLSEMAAFPLASLQTLLQWRTRSSLYLVCSRLTRHQ